MGRKKISSGSRLSVAFCLGKERESEELGRQQRGEKIGEEGRIEQE